MLSRSCISTWPGPTHDPDRPPDFTPPPPSHADIDAFIARIKNHFGDHGFGWWAVQVPGGAPTEKEVWPRSTPAARNSGRSCPSRCPTTGALSTSRSAIRLAISTAQPRRSDPLRRHMLYRGGRARSHVFEIHGECTRLGLSGRNPFIGIRASMPKARADDLPGLTEQAGVGSADDR
jgi:hypothetical protein